MMEADRLKERYLVLTTNLLEWIQNKLTQLDGRIFPNSIEGIQGQLLEFKQYRTIEKPPKYEQILLSLFLFCFVVVPSSKSWLINELLGI